MRHTRVSLENAQEVPLSERYARVRGRTEALSRPLAIDDYQIQSMPETSPPKWHLAHVTWFFEAFVLGPLQAGCRPYDARLHYLFNSYYETVGRMHPRPQRGLLSRPTVDEIYAYRAHVDEQMLTLLAEKEHDPEIRLRVTLGLQHEQQHQELLLMDIKHNLSVNPLAPAYRTDLACPEQAPAVAQGWEERPGGIVEIGHLGEGFAFDNETPRHQVLLSPHRLADRLVSNEAYLAFMADQGYQRPELWLADGWSLINREGWRHPLYWRRQDGEWQEFTLGGLRALDPAAPVSHLSYYEADAYARWAGARLPTEQELETRLAETSLGGNLLESDYLQPVADSGQWFGNVWQWTASSYAPYPGFRPLQGSLGEYNGKFMCNQMSLRGGCCLTSGDHIRASYRNFFYPHDRWPVTGLRLAQDM